MLIAWCALHRAGNWLYGSPNPRGPDRERGRPPSGLWCGWLPSQEAASEPMSRQMTPEEQAQGYALCDCGAFAFVWRAELLHWFPPGYHGELCPQCVTWACSVEKLGIAEEAKRRGELPDRQCRNGDHGEPW